MEPKEDVRDEERLMLGRKLFSSLECRLEDTAGGSFSSQTVLKEVCESVEKTRFFPFMSSLIWAIKAAASWRNLEEDHPLAFALAAATSGESELFEPSHLSLSA